MTLADGSLSDAIAEAMAARVALTASRTAAGGTVEALVAAIYRHLDVDPGWEPPEVIRRACQDGIFDAAGLAQLATAFGTGGKKQQDAAEMPAALAQCRASRPARRSTGGTKVSFSPRARPRAATSAPTSSRRDQAALARLYEAEQARVGLVCDRLRALGVARRTEALLRVGLRRHRCATRR